MPNPSTPQTSNRRKIPFGFCWPDRSELVNQSSLTCSALARKRTKDLPGIAVKKDIHVPADYMDPETFRKSEIRKGKDCGLVFVTNRPFGTDKDVKLILLAGFSGLGTIGAAKALIDDFRYLEPQRGEEYVYGVIQCRYRKAANSNVRAFKRNDWIVRVGGSWPIKVKVRKKVLPL